MASSVYTLLQGALDFSNGYDLVAERQNFDNNIKFVLDYFLKTHPEENVYYGQVGDGDIDHKNYNRPEL